MLACSILSFTACSNKELSKDNVPSNNETMLKQEEGKEKATEKIVESVLGQVKNQLKDTSKREVEITIENDTDYAYTVSYLEFYIKDNNGVNVKANLYISALLLEPGQKTFATLNIATNCEGMSDIKYIDGFVEVLDKTNKYDIVKANVSNVSFNSIENDTDYIECIIENNLNKNYPEATLYAEYVDEDGIIHNDIGSYSLSEFISGEKYATEINILYNTDIIKHKDDIVFKLLLHELNE